MHLAVRKRVSVETWAPVACLVVLMGVSAVVIMHAGRGTIFNFDDWVFIMGRDRWAPGALLQPHNEHLSLVPVLIYKTLFQTVGLDDYWVYRLVLTLMVLGCGALLFVYARPRVGPWLAVAVTAPVMLMGPAYWDLIWAFQIGFVGSLLAGLAALVALDRGTRRGDIAACVFLVASLASSSIGIPILLAIAIEVIWRDDRRQRIWIVAIPFVLYAAWYVKYGQTHTQWGELSAVPSWVLDGSPYAAGSAAGTGPEWGRLLAAALGVGVVAQLANVTLRVNPRLLALVAMPLIFWASAALARGGTPVTPNESRYLLPLGVFFVLIALELARRRPMTTRLALILSALLAAGALNNTNSLSEGGHQLRDLSNKLNAGITALEIAGRQVGDTAQPDTTQYIPSGLYFRSTEHYKSTPAWSVPEMLGKSNRVRIDVDVAEARMLGVQPKPVPPGLQTTACAEVAAGRPGEGPVGNAGVVIKPGSAAVDIRLVRFGSSPSKNAAMTVPVGDPALLQMPTDNVARPWRFSSSSRAPFEWCPAT